MSELPNWYDDWRLDHTMCHDDELENDDPFPGPEEEDENVEFT